ncbi:MAG: hypothetical protein QHH07_05070, partial [Sedimentisphaerales bacterium]|nr:hypothetical protein [Sedimentisphaerales bacterium]
LGKYYIRLGRVQEGLKLHRYNVEHYPYKDRYGLWSQIEIIKQGIVDGNDTEVDRQFSRLLDIFKDQPSLPREVYQIGYQSSRRGRHDRAKGYYRYVIDHWPDSEDSIGAQLALLEKQPGKGDASIDEVVDQLIAAFWHNKTPAKEVYEVAIWDAGKANELYNYVIDRWPDREDALFARAGLAHVEFMFGSEAKAERMLAALMGDFNDLSDLSLVVRNKVAETYYKWGMRRLPWTESWLRGTTLKRSFLSCSALQKEVMLLLRLKCWVCSPLLIIV